MTELIKEMKIMHDEKKSSDINIIIGGDSSNPSWHEYLNEYKLRFKPYIRGLRKAILELGLENTTAGEICNETWWQSKDGKVSISFSWRAWGDLLQAIHNKHEGYMQYYM